MAKRRKNKKSHLQAQYQQLQGKRRRGLIMMVGAIVLVIVLMIVKTYLESIGVEWATDSTFNMVFYAFIVVMAAVAGIGGRSWQVSGRQMREIASKLSH